MEFVYYLIFLLLYASPSTTWGRGKKSLPSKDSKSSEKVSNKPVDSNGDKSVDEHSTHKKSSSELNKIVENDTKSIDETKEKIAKNEKTIKTSELNQKSSSLALDDAKENLAKVKNNPNSTAKHIEKAEHAVK